MKLVVTSQRSWGPPGFCGPHFENHCSSPRSVFIWTTLLQFYCMLPYVISDFLLSINLIALIRNCIIYVVVSWCLLKCLALSTIKVCWCLVDTLELVVHVHSYVITYHILVGFAFYLCYSVRMLVWGNTFIQRKERSICHDMLSFFQTVSINWQPCSCMHRILAIPLLVLRTWRIITSV